MARSLRRRHAMWLISLIIVGVLGGGWDPSAAAAEPDPLKSLEDCVANHAAALPRLLCFDGVMQKVAATRPPFPKSIVVAELSGVGEQSFPMFRTTNSWNIEWEVAGEFLHVRNTDETGTILATYASQVGQGAGRSPTIPPGNYLLSVHASGNWILRFVLECPCVAAP